MCILASLHVVFVQPSICCRAWGDAVFVHKDSIFILNNQTPIKDDGGSLKPSTALFVVIHGDTIHAELTQHDQYSKRY